MDRDTLYALDRTGIIAVKDGDRWVARYHSNCTFPSEFGQALHSGFTDLGGYYVPPLIDQLGGVDGMMKLLEDHPGGFHDMRGFDTREPEEPLICFCHDDDPDRNRTVPWEGAPDNGHHGFRFIIERDALEIHINSQTVGPSGEAAGRWTVVARIPWDEPVDDWEALDHHALLLRRLAESGDLDSVLEAGLLDTVEGKALIVAIASGLQDGQTVEPGHFVSVARALMAAPSETSI